MIDAGRQIDVARQLPDLVESCRIVNVARTVLDHQRNGQRIAEIRMILVDLNKGIVFRQQIGEDRSYLNVPNPQSEYGRDHHKCGSRCASMLHHPVSYAKANRIQLCAPRIAGRRGFVGPAPYLMSGAEHRSWGQYESRGVGALH